MNGKTLAGRNLVSLLDFRPEEVERILELAAEVKGRPHRYRDALDRATLFMYFEKPSLRTRVTFETGMTQLGGHAIYYTAADGKIGVRESVEDVARNLERWVDGLMCRTFSHDLVVELANHAGVPVINGLTDRLHPCQALADLMTLAELRGTLEGRRLAYVGDGNNVAHSLLETGALLGVDVRVVTPPGYAPDAGIVERCREAAEQTGATLEVGEDLALVEGVDAVYTDVWASMGQEDEAAERMELFRPYQVDEALMRRAGDEAVFMHCLPAHRDEEVSAAVLDSARSVVYAQAENRLHAQKAVLLLTLGGV